METPLASKQETSSSNAGPLRAAFRWMGVMTFAGLLSVIAYLFYLGGYRHLLVDESASFAVELTMRILDANRDARLLVIGNSTVAEGFRASAYNKAVGPGSALNLGVGSAHFFVYEKLASLALTRGLRPQAVLVVLTPESLSLRPGYDELLNDITLMKTEIDMDDYARLWHHSRGLAGYAEQAGRLALRPVLFSSDVKDLLLHLRPRAEKIRTTYEWLKTAGSAPEALETDNNYQVCDAEPLHELEQALAQERTVSGSTRLADLERVWAGYSVRVNQPLAVDVRQVSRLEHLLRYLTAQIPKVYLAVAPYYDPDYAAYSAPHRAAFAQAVREATRRVAGTTLLADFPADCTMFFDTVHLNHAGGDRFTTFLREQIAKVN